MQVFKTIAVLTIGLLSGCDAQQAENSNNHVQADSSVPLIIALKDRGEGFQEIPSTLLIKQTVSGDSVESPESATVIIEEDIPTDDSVAAMRYVYQLSKRDDSWKIDSKDISQRCVSGRGSTDFSKELCR
ncbi:hypothetical protein CS369_06705 [Candidatus Symbiopectobacterium sp. 'North America']|uniref:hypothetical protein n=1 Tax=Candidatus Symbiopectobacterium sp. 'North America' TaxID=2794574 RepID=UPI0018C921F5|nr:hypothetical protein [Candidatus Symbiopectobacterium sp. 'North America']MBG6244557.1 hypothetical protein [Candidatus Symbiopectobacterium sp. 'North America']